MEIIQEKLTAVDWKIVAEEMNERGFCVLSGVVTAEHCEELKANYEANSYRKTVVMERYRFGTGEYKYFKYPLPNVLQYIRENLYPKLAPIANDWMKMLHIDKQFPDTFAELQSYCHANNQTKPTVLILKYGKGGYNTLHQDLYGDIFFPIQTVLFLSDPGNDFTGGEFVLTEQIPRAQSKAIVLNPKKGDLLLFTTNFRPKLGSKGYYRVAMKHGVSELHSGNRHSVGIIFHDALS